MEMVGGSGFSAGRVVGGDGGDAAGSVACSEGSGGAGMVGGTMGAGFGSATGGGCFDLADAFAGFRGGVSAITDELNPTSRTILKEKLSILRHHLFLPGNTGLCCLTRNSRG
jgi:hypothetical protein